MACLPERLEFVTYDVFTDTRFAGNPLAIVLGADDLTCAQMQTIAREFNLSETIFVQTPTDPSHRAQVRIFFPTAEIPFAGHPTIGCAIYLATLDHPTGDFDVPLVLEEQAGLVPVQVTRKAGQVRAEFLAPVLPFQPDQGQVPEISI
ncbi:PhzF family phenazine biosynthesis isomerase [Pseudaestuariivita rosea]|uniref:PhzF family phenazine biosynthesis protein n=1 Tax=Pseudaestuariivita rosea TaxID=2763263 RepID=UPI00301339C3